MRETDAIQAMRDLFAASPRQKNALFACDAELVELGSVVYGLSMDEFSPEEDMLPSSDPERLGKNLAVAVIADVLAAGCIPELYMHAVVAPKGDDAFCVRFARGVRSVLEEGGCFLLGGDFSMASAWRYTGFAMGRAGDTGPLTRILPQKPQTLWVTGRIGNGNRHAFAGTMPVFETRFTEAAAMRRIASACMDTSGGLAESLLMLSRCNPGHIVMIDGCAIPYDAASAAIVRARGIPEMALACGGAGEYELLFAAPDETDIPFATRIGTASPVAYGTDTRQSGVWWNGRKMPDQLPDPRAVEKEEYIRQVLEAAERCSH